MRKTDIEHWALNVIERVKNGQSVEDSRVELKATWIDHSKAARRIAGHANAAHGETILWLIGVDEKQGVKGVDYNEFANWFNAVTSQFDGVIPDSTSISVPYRGLAVLAIIFETDRAPYVVKNPSGGLIQFEVPWRDGTSTRSAKRAELLRMLVPLQRIPTIEVLSGDLTARYRSKDNTWLWQLELQLYVASMLQTTLAIPFHQCSATLELSPHLPLTALTDLALRPPPLQSGYFSQITTQETQRPQPDSLTIDGTQSELIVRGPGKFQLIASAETTPLDSDIANSMATIHAGLRPVDSERTILVQTEMVWDSRELKLEQRTKGRWATVRK